MASKPMQKISSRLPLVHRHPCLIFVSQIKYNGAILAGTILENVIVMIRILKLVLWAYE
jgi:hypothetical protein